MCFRRRRGPLGRARASVRRRVVRRLRRGFGLDDLQQLRALWRSEEVQGLLAESPRRREVACIPVLLRDRETLDRLVLVALHAGVSGRVWEGGRGPVCETEKVEEVSERLRHRMMMRVVLPRCSGTTNVLPQ